MQIAIASMDGKNVNGHFGSANIFMIYNLSKKEYSLANEIFFEEDNITKLCSKSKEMNEDKIEVRLKQIEGSKLLFVTSIGKTASARVMRENIYPIKLDSPEPIDQVLLRVQGMLSSNPPIWLKRVLDDESMK